jgi:hypothetical protein
MGIILTTSNPKAPCSFVSHSTVANLIFFCFFADRKFYFFAVLEVVMFPLVYVNCYGDYLE